MPRALILAHYDRDDLIDPHVIQALQIYRRLVDRLVVVSTAAACLPPAAAKLVDVFVTRQNEGYDFCSWKLGLERLVPHHEFDEIVFCNDSVYGPLSRWERLLDDPRVEDADLWGMVRSIQGPKCRGNVDCPHLQSWFFVMRKRAIRSPAFSSFWNRVQPLPTKEHVIEQYEIGLSETFAQAGLTLRAIYDTVATADESAPVWTDIAPHFSSTWSRIHHSWRLLKKARRRRINPAELLPLKVIDAGVPFVKVGVFRVNHYGLDLNYVRRQLTERQQSGQMAYDLTLIDDHLQRLQAAGAARSSELTNRRT